jgi:hypothetical protein
MPYRQQTIRGIGTSGTSSRKSRIGDSEIGVCKRRYTASDDHTECQLQYGIGTRKFRYATLAALVKAALVKSDVAVLVTS